ncbi:hypothetical protein FRC08_005733 [Ceratobasidium sp. 394]|nr:hypothetical protein FRC08_005733 [Ceratobasidium sp. 394]
MVSNQASHNPVTVMGVSGLTDSEIDAKRLLNNWRTCRSTLTVVVESYLAACTDLTTIICASSRQSHQRRGIETAILAIDTELTSLASEEVVLRNARVSLTAARNLSTTLAPIHALPPEVLASVFFMVQYDSSDVHDSKMLPPAQLLAGVSSYWRQVAINTPSLWTCIDITTTQTNYDYFTLLLDRSSNHPIYLTISEPNENNDRPLSGSSSTFLTRASRRVHTLDISSEGYQSGVTNTIMQLWLRHGLGGVTKVLRARRLRGDPLQLGLPGEQAGEPLGSVAVLALDDVTIPWTSMVYHNLVDLRLWFSSSTKARISISQLATVLASSPGLVILKIYGLEVASLDDWDATTAVQLVHLEALFLGNLSYRSCELLLPLIPLSNCLGDLSIGLEFRDWAGIAHLASLLW